MSAIQIFGLISALIISVFIDFFELKKAKKDIKVIVIYGLLLLLATIVSLEVILKIDVLNPNRLIENIVNNFQSRG